ncbi:MAG: hypothetical protein COV74_02805 [Candidatus Omnitrophica bacterium CG11_big_fil_rev_8_21_14_0_20_45_26]|uniref:Lysine transporter LysE n=1 Tax=Candidatus Abzuiibacterium crystallinum TaxID=1974748 RepID=A0A2H0LRC9_9BACT|nr:MAG: hypothetical protein COV74_02805 [Candidatus Omnitrophica bacterium CG11_big_fil_rev_8_21_14_0_20_45_26]PIW65548.1 MAG: hypothetical protein COW12_01115 [Candidatus Omnitrophica bacterium CG12_big_fil_rev_8_21_14_0_65_45_16]
MLISFLLGFVVALLSWQVNLIATHQGLRYRRSAAFAAGIGATFGDLIYLAIALTGSIRLEQFPQAWWLIKWISALVIIFMAARMFFYPIELADSQMTAEKAHVHSFAFGFILVVGNPLILLIWFVIVNSFLEEVLNLHRPMMQVFILAGFFLGSLSWFALLAGFLLEKINRLETKYLQQFSRAGGILLLFAGIMTLLKHI